MIQIEYRLSRRQRCEECAKDDGKLRLMMRSVDEVF